MFYDYDQNHQVETQYQDCVAGRLYFGSECRLIGDVNMKQNGRSYGVKGQDANAGIADSTWEQVNLDHENHRKRRIYRFALKDAPPFP